MLEDIKSGKIGTVIVKDMSRFGRNYLQVGCQRIFELFIGMNTCTTNFGDGMAGGMMDRYDLSQRCSNMYALHVS